MVRSRFRQWLDSFSRRNDQGRHSPNPITWPVVILLVVLVVLLLIQLGGQFNG